MKIMLGGREYDLSKPEDVVDALPLLVPANWPGQAEDCVKLFTNTVEMLCSLLRRHMAKKWLKICKVTQQNIEDNGDGVLKITFTFEIDQSVPTTAAISKNSVAFSAGTEKSEGYAQTCDLTQGDFSENLLNEPKDPSDPPPEPAAGADETTPGEEQADLPTPEQEPSYTPPAAEQTEDAESPAQAEKPMIVPIPGTNIDKPKRTRKKKNLG